MGRASGWRHRRPDAVERIQDEALRGNPLFLLHQPGPTSFVIREEKRREPVRVHLGDPHTCTCRQFVEQRDLCLHLCWTLLRKLKLQPDDPLSFQLGLVPSELCDLLSGSTHHQPQKPIRKKTSKVPANEELPRVSRRVVHVSDTCPICLDELLETRKPVTHCYHGCGNAVHITCMQKVAKHQLQGVPPAMCDYTMLSCPLCRGDFSSWTALKAEAMNAPASKPVSRSDARQERTTSTPATHTGISCTGCRQSPVIGVLHRCLQCPHVTLCLRCHNDDVGMRTLHENHGFTRKEKPGDAWCKAASPRSVVVSTRRLHSDAARRPASEDVCKETPSDDVTKVYREVLSQLTTTAVRNGSRLLLPGQQCCLCLNPYQIKNRVSTLPCGHQLHSRCILDWMNKSSSTCCPLDGTLIATNTQQFRNPQSGHVTTDAKMADNVPTATPTLEVSVTRVALSDRRGVSKTSSCAASSAKSSRQSYRLAGADTWGAAMEAAEAANKHYGLPARPLGSHSAKPLLSVHVSPRNQTLSQNRQAGVGGQILSGSTARLSITSLSLPSVANSNNATDDNNVTRPEYNGEATNNGCHGDGDLKYTREDDVPNKSLRQLLNDSDSDRVSGLDFLDDSDVSDLMDIKCLRINLAKRINVKSDDP